MIWVLVVALTALSTAHAQFIADKCWAASSDKIELHMIEQIHVGNAAICTESVDFQLILRFHKSAKTDMLTPKDLQIILHQWSNKYSFWYLQSSQSMIVGGQVFQSRLLHNANVN